MNGILKMFECPACSFSGGVGWSHQLFGSFAYAPCCGKQLLFRSKDSEWYPENGEKLEACVYKENSKEGWSSTGSFLPPFSGSSASESGYRDFLSVVLRNETCPCCNKEGQIIFLLKEGDECPACKGANIFSTGGLIP